MKLTAGSMARMAVLLLSLLWAASCNVINPAEPVPTYVVVDSFTFSQGSVVPGTASHKITSVTAYWEGKLLGIFYLPAKIPVIMEKKGTLALIAGIDFNALHGQQMTYPFFTSSFDTLLPTPGGTIMLHPSITYATNVRTVFQEDFEGGTGFIHMAGVDSAFNRTSDPAQVFEGASAGVFTVTSAGGATEIIATNATPIAVAQEAYLELDYRNEVPIQIGLQGFIGSVPLNSYIIGLKPRADWNKVYISLKEFVSNYQTGPYRIIIRAAPEEGGAGGKAFIDNLRIVTF